MIPVSAEVGKVHIFHLTSGEDVIAFLADKGTRIERDRDSVSTVREGVLLLHPYLFDNVYENFARFLRGVDPAIVSVFFEDRHIVHIITTEQIDFVLLDRYMTMLQVMDQFLNQVN